jgi:AraC-like DNA-binding protein
MENSLCLREVWLTSPEPWVKPGEGLWFVFPKAGAAEFVNGPVYHRLSPRVALVANVGSAPTIIRPATPEFHFRFFHVSLETLFPLLSCREIPRLRAAAAGLRTGQSYLAVREPAVQCLALLQKVPIEDNLDHRTLLLRVAAVFLEHEMQAVHEKQLPAASASERIRQLLDGISTKDLLDASVDELALKFGYSRRHLNRLFQAQFGFSVGALRMEMRLLKAAQLLRDPNAKVINVATEAGFNHQGLFNSYFRRRFGLSPSLWRKNMLNDPLQSTMDPETLPMPGSQHAGPMDIPNRPVPVAA